MSSLGKVRPNLRVEMGGVYSGSVRVGNRFLVPKHVFVEIRGELGDPDVQAHCEWRDDGPRVTELKFTCKPDGRGLISADLEWLRPEGLARKAFRGVAMSVLDEPSGFSAEPIDWSDPANENDWWALGGLIQEAANRVGPRGVTQLELRLVADTYDKAKAAKKNVLTAVAMALGGVSESTAVRRVTQARKAGLLDLEEKGRENVKR